MADSSSGPSLPFFEQVCKRFGLSFPPIEKARRETDDCLDRLKRTLKEADVRLDVDSDDSTLSLVVFGSIARREWTTGSDVDWTLLVDGPVNPNHSPIATRIQEALRAAKYVEPGPTGTFGKLASSHDLVHHIGGLSDSNENMTRLLLLLLESHAVINPLVRNRVITSILDRYLVCGRGIREPSTHAFQVPRFLLNDVVRYWRTLAVDYAAKKWEQADKKWALRNAKLRVSRKLLFVKGLLLCYDCELFPRDWP